MNTNDEQNQYQAAIEAALSKPIAPTTKMDEEFKALGSEVERDEYMRSYLEEGADNNQRIPIDQIEMIAGFADKAVDYAMAELIQTAQTMPPGQFVGSTTEWVPVSVLVDLLNEPKALTAALWDVVNKFSDTGFFDYGVPDDLSDLLGGDGNE